MHAYQEKFINSHFSFCNCINFGSMVLCVFINFNYETVNAVKHTHARARTHARTHARTVFSFPLIKNMSFVCIHMIVLLDHT